MRVLVFVAILALVFTACDSGGGQTSDSNISELTESMPEVMSADRDGRTSTPDAEQPDGDDQEVEQLNDTAPDTGADAECEAAIEAAISALRIEISGDLNTRDNDLRAEIDVLRTDLDALAERVDTLEQGGGGGGVCDCNVEVGDVQSSVNTLAADVAVSLADIRDDITALEAGGGGAVCDCTAEILTVSQDLSAAQTDITTLQTSTATLTSDLNTLAGSVTPGGSNPRWALIDASGDEVDAMVTPISLGPAQGGQWAQIGVRDPECFTVRDLNGQEHHGISLSLQTGLPNTCYLEGAGVIYYMDNTCNTPTYPVLNGGAHFVPIIKLNGQILAASGAPTHTGVGSVWVRDSGGTCVSGPLITTEFIAYQPVPSSLWSPFNNTPYTIVARYD